MLIKALVNHNGCWSQLLSSYEDITGELLNQKINRNEYIDAYVAFHNTAKSNYHNIWTDFFKELKGQHAVISVNHIETIDKGKVYMTRISTQLESSLSDVVNTYNCPYFKEFFYQGKELWYIYSWHELENKVISEIKNRSRIIELQRLNKDYFSNEVLPFQNFSNFNLLKYSYENGYYSNKKEINLNLIANHFGTSKSNISRKLKYMERKIIRNYIESTFK